MPFSLLRPYPLVYGLLADHGLPIALITSGNLLGAVLTIYYQAPHISLHLVGELDVVRPLLHVLLIFTLGKVPSVGTLAPLVTVAFDLTATVALVTHIVWAMMVIVICLCSITDIVYL